MNITDHFVFVHMPKTGGSFVSAVLRELYGIGWLHNVLLRQELLLVIKYKLLKLINGGKVEYQEFNKHGTCRDISAEFTHLPILSCIRNPLDWYVSNYKYAWWKSHPQDYPGLQNDSRWPDLSFTDYLKLSHTTWTELLNPRIEINPSLGRLTILFINYYCRHPNDIVTLQTDEDLFSAIQSDMFPVTFLNTANLNKELYYFLLKIGAYATEQIAFILEKEKISPRNHRQRHETWPSFYSAEEKEEIQYRDRFLFRLFPYMALNESG